MNRFYSNTSCFVHGGVEKPGEEQPPVTGQEVSGWQERVPHPLAFRRERGRELVFSQAEKVGQEVAFGRWSEWFTPLAFLVAAACEFAFTL